jgi:hypothetical protein
VSAAVAPLYVKLADDLRHLRSLGAP